MAYESIQDAITYGWETERLYRCHDHDDRKPSAYVNGLTGAYYCHSCGSRGRIDLDTYELSPEGLSKAVKQALDAYSKTTEFYPEAWLNIYDSTGPGDYWPTRFTEETCRLYRLGQTNSYATYPMRDNAGRVLGVVRRNLDPDANRKYLYPKGVKARNYLFDYHEVSSDVILLVEGAADAIACTDAGYRVALATYGTGISKVQAALLRRYDPKLVLVAYDQDKAGEIGYRNVQQVLDGDLKVERLEWSDYKDLAAIPLAERMEHLGSLMDAPLAPLDQTRLESDSWLERSESSAARLDQLLLQHL